MNLYAQPTLPYGHPGAAGSIYSGAGGVGGGSFHQAQQLYPSAAAPTTLAKAGRRESATSYFASNAIADYRQQQSQVPSNEQLHQDVMEILAVADLQTLTKKKVRQELEQKYGIAIEGERKTFVNRVIGEALGLQ
jgi:chitin synthase